MKEFERDIHNPSLMLTGRITGYAPVQGAGTVNGHQFYFRARHDEWSFAVSEDPKIDPVDIQLPDVAEQHGFLVEGTDYNASYLDLSEAQKIIEDCCKLYLNKDK